MHKPCPNKFAEKENWVKIVLGPYLINHVNCQPTFLIRFGAERPAEFQHPSTWSVEPFDKQTPGSYVTFVFRYRSKGPLIFHNPMYALVTSCNRISGSPRDHKWRNLSRNCWFFRGEHACQPQPKSSDLFMYEPKCCKLFPLYFRSFIHPSDPGSQSGTSDRSESAPLEYGRHIDRYPGQGMFWFNPDQEAADQPRDQHLDKKARTQ